MSTPHRPDSPQPAGQVPAVPQPAGQVLAVPQPVGPGATAPPPAAPAAPEAVLAALERTTDQIIGRDDLLDRLREGRPLRIECGGDLAAAGLHLGGAVNRWRQGAAQA